MEHKVIGLPSTSAEKTFDYIHCNTGPKTESESGREDSPALVKMGTSMDIKAGHRRIGLIPRGNDGLPYKSNKSNTTERDTLKITHHSGPPT